MIRERDIERKACDLAKEAGWLVFKFVSPAQRGVPDRIFIRQGRIVFIEFKAPGARPTKLQWRMIERLRDQGCEVHVCDSVESACDALGI
jgi:Holliday junction resolvase